jgi:DNA-binding NarL/FixJ family response regulator
MAQEIIRVVIAEDNPIVRSGIRKLLKKAQGIELIGEAWNGMEALRIVNEMKPDVLLLDVEMPIMDGITVTRQLKNNAQAQTRILVLSAYNDKEYIRGMLLNGASGYLLKDEAPQRIIEAVHEVALGKTNWVNPYGEFLSKPKKRRTPRP